jgi:hypothetical protein
MKMLRVITVLALACCCAPVLAQGSGVPGPCAPSPYVTHTPSYVFGSNYHLAYESRTPAHIGPQQPFQYPQYAPPPTYLNTGGGSQPQFQPWGRTPVYPNPQQALRAIQNADPQRFLFHVRGW